MENGRYVQIRCRACCIKTLVIAGRPWPKRCIRCGEPCEAAPPALDVDPRATVQASVRPGEASWRRFPPSGYDDPSTPSSRS